MSTALSFEQAPPISVPFRFFLTAPLFGAAAGILVALRGDAILASRWSAETLAAVHLVTIGLMMQVMAGALLQFLPVAAGASFARPRLTAAVAHAGLTLGTALLVAGFLLPSPDALGAAAVVLGVALAFYACQAAHALARSPAIGPSLPALRIAGLGLVVTAGLGVALAAALGFGLTLPIYDLVDLHAAWGILGWSLGLVVAVGIVVVPMFQLTPPYPLRLARALPWALLLGVLAWTGAIALRSRPLEWAALALGGGALVTFAVETLRLQARRRRRTTDTTLRYWRLGMACLLLGAALFAARPFVPAGVPRARTEYAIAVALVAGAFPAIIAGMLLKIVAFLDWLHLERVMKAPPTMHQALPDAWARPQLAVFCAALACLLGAALWPPLVVPGGVLYAVACLHLEGILVASTMLYVRLAREARGAGEEGVAGEAGREGAAGRDAK